MTDTNTPKPPRRRVKTTIKIQADSWEDMRGALRCIQTDLAISGGSFSNSVAEGYSFGWIITSDEDETITHESWAEENDLYCIALTAAGTDSQ